MTTEKLFEMSGLSGTFDPNIPQERHREIANALGENPLGHIVWWYPSRDDKEYDTCGMGGKPLLVSRLFALAVERRKLIETKEKEKLLEVIDAAMDTGFSPSSYADIRKCVTYEMQIIENEKGYYDGVPRPISRDVMIERLRKRGIDERSIQGEDILANVERDQREWNENCERDGIDPSVSFACFSSDNK